MSEDSLPDAELEVLSCLWQQGHMTAREVREHLIDSRPLSHSAVSTLLQRLMDKQMVVRRKAGSGKSFVYRAVRKSERAGRRLADGILSRVFGDNPLAIVSSLFESRSPTSEELDQLQALLDELRRNQASQGGTK